MKCLGVLSIDYSSIFKWKRGILVRIVGVFFNSQEYFLFRFQEYFSINKSDLFKIVRNIFNRVEVYFPPNARSFLLRAYNQAMHQHRCMLLITKASNFIFKKDDSSFYTQTHTHVLLALWDILSNLKKEKILRRIDIVDVTGTIL